MLAKVEKIYDRFKELEQMMQLPDLASDGQKYAKVMKEYTSLSPIAEAYVAYKENQKAAEDARLLMEDSSVDAELRELAEEEYRALRENERTLRCLPGWRCPKVRPRGRILPHCPPDCRSPA